MKFQTTIDITPIKAENAQITLQTPILLLGSCFSDEIGVLLETDKFQTLVNPFGTIFNPISCFDLLIYCLQNQELPTNSFVKREELYFNYLLHSEFFAYQLADLQEDIKHCQEQVRFFFSNPNQKFLILTLGTAYIYELNETEINPAMLIANCHKLPAKLFTKRLLNVAEIIEKFTLLYNLLPKNIHIILTVSPVRHLKDTLQLNSVSKAVLRLACYELCELSKNKSSNFSNISYFPSYEIMTDEFRDYRFYATDMIHPSLQAVQYIYEKFCQIYMNQTTLLFVEKWQKMLKKLNHHTFHTQTFAHKQFLQSLLQELQAITEVNVSNEIENVTEKLQNLTIIP
jgi:hypothetical protein